MIFDVDATPAQLASTDNLVKDRQFSQELQLLSTSHDRFTWATGIYYIWYHGDYAHTLFINPASVQDYESGQRTKSPAVYAQGTYKLTHTTSLTIGGRYSWEDRVLDAHGSILTKSTNFKFTPEPIHATLSVHRPTWCISVDQKLDPNVLIYISYNRGFKSGGFNALSFLLKQNYFKPEVLNAYEVGVKSDLLNRKLQINGATFYYDYKDIQLTSFVNGILTINNAAKARIYGLDVDLTAKPAESLSLTAGLSYIHSRFKSFPNAQEGAPLLAGGNLIFSGDVTGYHLPYTPNWTLDLGADYNVPLDVGSPR